MQDITAILIIIIGIGWILYIRRLDRQSGGCGWEDMKNREPSIHPLENPLEMVRGAYKLISTDYKNGHIYSIDVEWHNTLMKCIGSTKRIEEDVSQEELLKDLIKEYNFLHPGGPRIDITT
jgi:hypothetical protein